MLTAPTRLSSTRRKRAIPQDWTTPDALQTFDATSTSEPLAPGGRSLAVDKTGDLVLLGGNNGVASVYSISQQQLVRSLKCGSGAVVDGAWYGDRPIVALSTGAIKVFDGGKELASFSKHAGAVVAISLHPCGDVLASIGADKSLIYYDLQTMKPITQQHTDSGTLTHLKLETQTR